MLRARAAAIPIVTALILVFPACTRDAAVPSLLRDDPCAGATPYAAPAGALDVTDVRAEVRIPQSSVRYVAMCLDGAPVMLRGPRALTPLPIGAQRFASLTGEHELTAVFWIDRGGRVAEPFVARSSHVVDVGSVGAVTATLVDDDPGGAAARPRVTWRDRPRP